MGRACPHLAALASGGPCAPAPGPAGLATACASCAAPARLHCVACLLPGCLLHCQQHAQQQGHPLALDLDLAPAPSFYCALCDACPEWKKSVARPRWPVLEQIVRRMAAAAPGAAAPPRGLVNLGNTCFMNATLQVLAAAFGAAPTATAPEATAPLWTCLTGILAQIRPPPSAPPAPHTRPVNPRDLLQLLARRYSKLAQQQQQDAHDFLRLLFNGLAEEHKGQPMGAPHAALFGGRSVSRVVCQTCRAVSDTPEAFLDVSLSLRRPDADALSPDADALSLEALSLEALSVEALFLAWAQKTELAGENGYWCERCQQRRAPHGPEALQPATLRYYLDLLPRHLIVHLQRFRTAYRPGAAASAKKGRRRAASPTCYIEKDDCCVAAAKVLCLPRTALLRETDHDEDRARFQLTGFVVHEGASTAHGHYTAVVAHGCRWFHVSDTAVAEIPEHRALDPAYHEPYLLFYRRLE